MTNIDKIRAMTEEELARFIQQDICDEIIGVNHCFTHGVCLDCVIDWLRQEVEE